jgi:hypothetical protein
MGTKPYYYQKNCAICGAAFSTTNRGHLCCGRTCGTQMRESNRFAREEREGAYALNGDMCWVWQGHLSGGGYGPHRRYYRHHRGPISKGLHIDHLCRNRACVNPWHMEAVTQKVNSLRGVGAPAQNARKTHCKHGHELTPENTYKSNDRWRGCRECRRQYFRDYRKRAKAKLAARDHARWPARRDVQNAARRARHRVAKAAKD